MGGAAIVAALLLCATLAVTRGNVAAQTGRPPSLALIEEARRAGEIDDESALVYKVYTVFAPERLPERFQSDTPAKSATMVFVEILRSWDGLRPDTQTALAEFIVPASRAPLAESAVEAQDRPTYTYELTHTTPHFVIHYTLSGTHAVFGPELDEAPANGVPDYVDWVAEDAETVWEAELSTMGWLEPPPDAGEGGDTRYDVYIRQLGSFYGWTQYDGGYLGDNPNSPSVTESEAYYSYLSLHKDLGKFPGTRRGNIRVTLAHEFNHAVQFGYDTGEAVWLMEATATWMEDEVYDDINDNYQFLDKLFTKPDVALDTEDGAAYGYSRFVFPRYIAEHHGGQATVRTIWENSVLSDSLEAVEGALKGAGTEFLALFPRFVAANYVLSSAPYNEPYTYEEASGYKEEVGAMTVEAYFPFTGTAQTYNSFDDGNATLERHSAEYWVISATTSYDVVFHGNPGTAYAVQGALRDGELVTVKQVPLAAQEGTLVVHDPGAYDEVVVIVANVGGTDEEEGYTLELQPTSETPPTAVFGVHPVSGTWTTTVFTFDASASSDVQTPNQDLQMRWDWDCDRIWDTPWSVTKTATHTFGAPGTYSVTLEVRDGVDLRSQATRSVEATACSVYLPVAIHG